MVSTILIHGLGGNLGKKETELNERIAEKENAGVASPTAPKPHRKV